MMMSSSRPGFLERRPRAADLGSHHAELRLSALDEFYDPRGIADHDPDADFRIRAQERSEQVRKHVLTRRGARAQSQASRHLAAESVDLVSGALEFVQHLARVGHESATGLGQIDPAVAPVEERCADIGLERLKLHRDRRLRDPQRSCGLREGAVVDHGEKRSQLGDVHLAPLGNAHVVPVLRRRTAMRTIRFNDRRRIA